MSNHVSIAIIGGGASGTLTALHLLRKLNISAQIYLIEKRREATYRGNAYSSQLSYEPLNVPTGAMSLYSHLPDDFYYWLKSRKQAVAETEITRESFVSRRWFGDYMTERIESAADLASHITFETIIDEASDINFDAVHNAYSINFKSRGKLYVHYVIFATGNEPPSDIFNKTEIASLNDHYVGNPWAVNPLDGISAQDNVLVIGTGLTMVDHVISLHKQGHAGKIYCFSRHGYLPLPHAEDIQSFVFEFNDEQRQLSDIFEEIKRNVALAGSRNIQWQNTLDAMRGKTSRMWELMDIGSKQLFLKRLRRFWEIHRHRMPLASANVLISMSASGQLEIISGKMTGLKVQATDIAFKFITKNSKDEREISVQRIINCTGPSGDYFKTNNELVKNLLTKGWMKQDELKIGICTGVRGEIIQNNGVVLQNAFSIGPLRKAMEWESTAILEIRMQAEETASYISALAEKNYEVTVEIGL